MHSDAATTTTAVFDRTQPGGGGRNKPAAGVRQTPREWIGWGESQDRSRNNPQASSDTLVHDLDAAAGVAAIDLTTASCGPEVGEAV